MNKTFSKCLMLDIGRKYFSPESIRSILDTMAGLGMNALSLHFSEDMGVGIECPAYPFLAGRDGMLCPYRPLGTVHPDERFLTLGELAELIRYAAARDIRVIPSYDSPGHLNYTVKRLHDKVRAEGAFEFSYGPDRFRIACSDGLYAFYKNGEALNYPKETSGIYGIGSFYTLNGQVSRVKGTNNTDYSRGIDLCNEVAVAFVRSVAESYARLFRTLGCRSFDIGCDELLGYGTAVEDLKILPKWRQLDAWQTEARRRSGLDTAVAYDLFVTYANETVRQIRELGYDEVLIWNDEFCLSKETGWNTDPREHVQFTKGLTVQYWSSDARFASPVFLAENGYSLVGASSRYCYYVLIDDARCDPPKAYRKVNPDTLRDEWEPCAFAVPENGVFPANQDLRSVGREQALTGSMFCVWCDCPILRTDAEVAEELRPLLAAWNDKLDRTIR